MLKITGGDQPDIFDLQISIKLSIVLRKIITIKRITRTILVFCLFVCFYNYSTSNSPAFFSVIQWPPPTISKPSAQLCDRQQKVNHRNSLFSILCNPSTRKKGSLILLFFFCGSKQTYTVFKEENRKRNVWRQQLSYLSLSFSLYLSLFISISICLFIFFGQWLMFDPR